jgi:RNA polymerase sigma-70 factor, ECF subfamily
VNTTAYGALPLLGRARTGSKPAPKPSTDKIQAERREQFEALALPLLDRLYSMALHLVRDPVKADDMVQETVLRAWQNFDRFTIGTHFKAWIFQILTYLFLNDRRSAQRRETQVDFTEHDVIPAPAVSDTVPSANATVARVDWDRMYPSLVDDVMKTALDRLPEEQRMVFLLVTLGDLSYQETAEMLSIPIGTVMSRLFRARKQLQTELSGYAKDRGFLRDGQVID